MRDLTWRLYCRIKTDMEQSQDTELPPEELLQLNAVEASKDTPIFRYAILTFCEGVDGLAKWMEAYCQTVRNYTEDMSSLNPSYIEANESLLKTARKAVTHGLLGTPR